MAENQTTRNACIATALALVVLVVAAPVAAADDEPQAGNDGSVTWGECAYVNPWTVPPTWHISVPDCLPS